MTIRERILAAYRGEPVDSVPCMLDLSHWYYHRHRQPWALDRAYDQPERDLIEYHRRMGVGFYIPNLGSMYSVRNRPDVTAETERPVPGRIVWRYRTPLGTIERSRAWDEQTYSWHIDQWGIRTERDLEVLGYAMSGRTFEPLWDRYRAWTDCVGDDGVVYLSGGYSAMGYLLNYWMGIEATMYAAADWPDTLHAVVDQINGNNLEMIDMLARSPAEIVIMGDNFSSNVQSPPFFAEWSRPYYAEAIRRLHAAGKYVAVHVDGYLRGAIAMFQGIGADCIDAVTPKPMGDLTAAECLAEAGSGVILSGGVSPDLWLPAVPEERFVGAVRDWLDLGKRGGRIILAAGDQVPPGADERRVGIVRDMAAGGGGGE